MGGGELLPPAHTSGPGNCPLLTQGTLDQAWEMEVAAVSSPEGVKFSAIASPNPYCK